MRGVRRGRSSATGQVPRTRHQQQPRSAFPERLAPLLRVFVCRAPISLQVAAGAMRTPAVMIVGLVLAPCGLVLALTCTFAPDWRVQAQLPNQAVGTAEHQGLWDICQEREAQRYRQCGQEREAYYASQEVRVGRALMITSLAVTLLGLGLAAAGVRCWQDEPNYALAGAAGLVIFASGVLSLVPISWYNFQLYNITGYTPGFSLSVGYSLVLGYIGSCFEIIGGFCMALSFVHSCKECLRARRKGSPGAKYYSQKKGGGAPPYSLEPSKSSAYTMDYSIRSAAAAPAGGAYGGEPQWGDHISDPQRRFYSGDRRQRDSVSTAPRSYTNPLDVTAGEHPYRGPPGPRSHLSSLPCDSDLL
ncbi:claudin-23 [Ambystoma mexicanum]|uniref:claudin-23 n=1 Tax=Ambystoma mexicanum TaxID=8296 RepID=UPI0037E9C3FA